MANAEVAIKVTEVKSAGHFFASLIYRGKSFQVPNVDKPWPAAEWPSHLEALRAAAAYRETWVAPSDAVLVDIERRSNSIITDGGWH